MRTSALLGLVCIGLLCAACGEKKSDSGAPATSAAPVTSAAAGDKTGGAQAPSGSPAAPGSAAPAGGAGGLKTMFAGPPEAGTKDSETVYHAGGVVLGFPAGWKSGNVKETEDETVDVVGTGFTAPLVNATLRGAEIFCHTMENPFGPAYVSSSGKHANFQKDKWTEETDGTVGAESYPAKLGKGTGEQISGTHQPVVTYYVYSTIPGAAKPVLCVASYPASHPELEKDIVTAFKGMKLPKK